MSLYLSRRSAIALGGSLFASVKLPALQASDVSLASGAVQFRPEIEPLVRLLEDTPRERIMRAVADEIRGGRSYRECLAALFLAAIRNVQPRPAVGFKFHSVLVVNSAHLASLASVDAERWLPLFWAIDYFKRAQQQDTNEGNWTMAAVDENRLPAAAKAEQELRSAMAKWDVDAADAAAASAARVLSAHQLFDLFAEFGSRDFRSIGHKAIYVAGAFRVLNVIGWEYAEPVMRSLAYALLNHSGDPNPGESDLAVDRQGRENVSRAEGLRGDWLEGRVDSSATQSFVEAARSASPAELSTTTAKMIQDGTSATSVFDGLFAASAELVMRQPAIVPLHAMTTTNAMHYLFQHVHDDALRRWLVLQNAAFLGHFRESAEGRGKLVSAKINELEPGESAGDLAQVFRRGESNPKATASVLGYLKHGGDAVALMRHARELVFHKGDDAHDYKYSSALLEDYYARSPEWRDRILAAGSALLPDENAKDTGLAERVREAFA
ncbi:MAG: hypothetical protein ACO1RT_11115 [Planctomycetaceae bacterium]